MGILAILFLFLASIGHAVWLTWLLNNLYGRPIPKWGLKIFRLFVGCAILGFPLFLVYRFGFSDSPSNVFLIDYDFAGIAFGIYLVFAFTMGGLVFPALTLLRLFREKPAALIHESTRTLDLWQEAGHKLIGDGHWSWFPRLPLNHIFRVDFTDWTLQLPRLPKEWDGLTILLISDFHFHGTPSQLFFQRIIDEINSRPTPDIVALLGDYVDSDQHHEWIEPILGQLRWKEHGLAILGNHDANHDPDRVRRELGRIGFRVCSDRIDTIPIRNVPCTILGHEGPWLPTSSLPKTEPGTFTLGLSHTPDNIYELQIYEPDLVLCGHVHGGQIRLPIIGSIFVPSIYSRRFDMGVHQVNDTVMAISRGLSGKEPLRFRCHPQVVRITLTPGG